MKKLLFVSLFATMLLAGCKPQATTESNQPTSSPEAEENLQENTTRANVDQLMAQGKPLTCTFSTTVDDTVSEGTVYIDGASMRGEFSAAKVGQSAQTSYMVRVDDYAYIWGDAYPQGMKMKIDPTQPESTMTQNQQSFDWQQAAEYDCDDWNPDASLFEIPEDITFQDLSAQMESVKNMMGDDACAACASLTGNAQAQCKQALKCE